MQTNFGELEVGDRFSIPGGKVFEKTLPRYFVKSGKLLANAVNVRAGKTGKTWRRFADDFVVFKM